MKKILFFLLAPVLVVQAQNYALDPTFGDAGMTVKAAAYSPGDILFLNDSYYLTSHRNADGKIAKVLYDGSLDLDFGTGGYLSLGNTGVVRRNSGFKFLDGWIYVYGTNNPTTSQQNGFVARLGTDGVLDASFGNGGFVDIDLGALETLNDVATDAAGNVICVGTKSSYDPIVPNVLFYLRITDAGTIDTAFDGQGYKTLPLTTGSNGGFITTYGDGFLISGVTLGYDSVSNIVANNLVLAKVNTDGQLDLTYGDDGLKFVPIQPGYSNSLMRARLQGSVFYMDYYAGWSFSNKGYGMLKYDLATDQTVYNHFFMGTDNLYSHLSGDLSYVAFGYGCGGTITNCPGDFVVKRYLADGTLDATFNNGGTYTYTFPTSWFLGSDSTSMCLTGDGTGRYMVAGYTRNVNSSAFQFAMIRIGESTLGVSGEAAGENSITPNPFREFLDVPSGNGIRSVSLTDMTGRSIPLANPIPTPDRARLDLDPALAPGTYVIRISYKDETVVRQKLVKQ